MLKSKKNKNANLSRAQQDLIAASKMNISELCNKYNSSVNGFQNDEQVVLNKSEYGANILSKKSKNSVLKRIVDAFFNPFSIILIILSLISIIVDIILPLRKGESAEPATIIIIMSMVIISGILHIVEDTKSSSSADQISQNGSNNHQGWETRNKLWNSTWWGCCWRYYSSSRREILYLLMLGLLVQKICSFLSHR